MEDSVILLEGEGPWDRGDRAGGRENQWLSWFRARSL